MEIILARACDLAEVDGILEEARQWLLAKGITGQWPLPEDPVRLANRIHRQEVYLAKQAQESVGTFSLQWSDTTVWGDVPPDAGYVHGLAIRRRFAGKGIGIRLLDHASALAAQSGKQFLRLDCWAGNAALCRYYEQAGFTYRGYKEWLSPDDKPAWRANLYERPIDVVMR